MFSKLLRNGSGPSSKGPRQETADPADQASPDTPASDGRDVLHMPGGGSPDGEGSIAAEPPAVEDSTPENVSEKGQMEAGAGEPEEHTEDKILRQPGGVDEFWYKSTYPDVAAANISAVQHYRLYGWKEGRDPNPEFSTNWYLQENSDVALVGINPLVHFLEYGRKEGRRPHSPETAPWGWLAAQGTLFPKLGSSSTGQEQEFGTAGRRKIVFAGHDASRTGAPLSLLALVEHYARDAEQEIFIFLRDGGPLLEQYRRYGNVIIHDGRPSASSPPVSALIASLAHPRPRIAICNSTESWPLCSAFSGAGLKVISLVRESISSYPAAPVQTLLECSSEIVFNSRAMKELAIEVDVRFENARILSQGLHRPGFGTRDRTQAKSRLSEQLRLPNDTKIVLGCGTRTFRKGFDIFCQLASGMLDTEVANVHFLWVGGSASNDPELEKWMKLGIKILGRFDRMTVIDTVEDTEPYFLAADAFVLTSRDDPFPNVVLQAMSAALPIVLFERSGGGPEAIADGCGIAVPYLKVGEMAKAVTRILTSAELADRMGEKARDRVQSTYRFRDYADKIQSLAANLEIHPSASAADV